jgi:hypothetical protein
MTLQPVDFINAASRFNQLRASKRINPKEAGEGNEVDFSVDAYIGCRSRFHRNHENEKQ